MWLRDGSAGARLRACERVRDRAVVTATLILHFISNVATVWCHLRCTCVVNVRADSVPPCPCPAQVRGFRGQIGYRERD